MRQIVIGDIHGCFDELLALLEEADVSADDMLISVGDVVDRGPKSVEAVAFFRNRPNSKVLMGNHERKHVNGIYSYAQEIVRLQFGDGYPDAVEWMRHLDYYYETENALIVHAAFEHDVPLEEQREDVLCGSTSGNRHLSRRYGEQFRPAFYAGEKPIIYGHHVVGDEPEVTNGKVWGIDTGACHGGRLTAVILPGFEVVSVPVAEDHWELEKQRWQIPVFESRAWREMSFGHIEKEIRRFRRNADADFHQTLDTLQSWMEDVAGTARQIVEHLQAEVAELEQSGVEFNQAASARQYSSWLFLTRAGRLSEETLAAKMTTPAQFVALASQLGVTIRHNPF